MLQYPYLYYSEVNRKFRKCDVNQFLDMYLVHINNFDIVQSTVEAKEWLFMVCTLQTFIWCWYFKLWYLLPLHSHVLWKNGHCNICGPVLYFPSDNFTCTVCIAHTIGIHAHIKYIVDVVRLLTAVASRWVWWSYYATSSTRAALDTWYRTIQQVII